MWFREYLLNILIQPFHLLLYMVLVGGAMNLVETNIIYAIVAIGFLTPAEKLLRKFFGFDNAGTLSAAGSFAGGAVFSAMINKINKPHGGKDGEKEEQKPTRKLTRDRLVDVDSAITGGTPPSGGGTPPSGGRTPPSGGGTPPSGGGTPPSGGGTPPSGGGTPPSGGGTPPSGGGTPPSGGGTPPLFGSSSDELLDIPKGFRDSPFGPGGRTIQNAFSRAGGMLGRAGTGIGTRLGSAGRAIGYRGYRKVVNGVKKLPKTAGRWTRKAVVGGIAGGGLALAGAAMGIATGDPSKVAQMAMAGGAAGFYGANYYGDKIAKGAGELGQGMKTSFWGKDMKDIDNAKFDRQYMNDPKIREALTKSRGSRKEVVQDLKDGSVQACLNNGIQDPSKMGKILKLRDKLEKKYISRGMNQEQARDQALARAIGVGKYSSAVSPRIIDKFSQERAIFDRRMMNQLTASGMSQEQAKSKVDELLEELDDFFE